MRSRAITNKRHLLAILGLKKDELEKLLLDIPDLYSPYLKREKKKDGTIKERNICPSLGKLKTVQGKIKNWITNEHELPDYIQGGRKKKDSITNAKPHKGKHFHFCLDLKNFFPSVKNWRVNKVLLRKKYHPDIASIITKLVTLEKTVLYKGKPIVFRKEIPQGAPTSTAITNLVFYEEVDIKLEKVIKDKRITYTRYVDDLNFSSQTDFIEIVYEIVKVVSEAKFKINRKKTFYKRGKVEITGTDVCQNGLLPTKRLLDKYNDPEITKESKAGVENHIKRIKAA